MTVRAVAVFCGSRHGARPAYTDAARATGAAIARRGWQLIYGGGRVGLMGEVAQAALDAGGEVIGVIPDALLRREVGAEDITELHVVDTMHERKAMMTERADAFLALPGGFGTLEEVFEVVTWAQLGIHGKPFGLLEVEGYYRQLVAFLDHAVEEGFIDPVQRSRVHASSEPDTLLDALAEAGEIDPGDQAVSLDET